MGFYRVLSPDELMHHGILGMKWGKKNGPPYPLSSSAHSSSEKKAGWRKSLDGGTKEKNAFSAKAAAHKVLAKNYGINEKFYSKRNGKTSKMMARLNREAKADELKKAEAAQSEANARKAKRNEEKLAESKQRKKYAFGRAAEAEKKRAIKSAKLGLALEAGAAGTALVSAAAITALSKKGKKSTAAMLYGGAKIATFTLESLAMGAFIDSGSSAVASLLGEGVYRGQKAYRQKKSGKKK